MILCEGVCSVSISATSEQKGENLWDSVENVQYFKMTSVKCGRKIAGDLRQHERRWLLAMQQIVGLGEIF